MEKVAGCKVGIFMYRIFSIKLSRRLFQTWLHGSGVYLTFAVYSSLEFIRVLIPKVCHTSNVNSSRVLFTKLSGRPNVYSGPGV